MRTPFLVLIVLFAGPCWSETLFGRVVGVSDGDTVILLDASRAQHKIRLEGIDAPEKRQPFGEVSKQNLARLIFGKAVKVHYEKRDRYDRIVGKVLVDGSDACLRQIQDGMAWHFKRYQNEQSPADRLAYERAEQQACLAKWGLWRDPHAMPPWEFRKTRQQHPQAVQAYRR
jgi:endonuclease YncB( thermonuclease family)